MKLCIFAACIVAALSAEARLRLRDSEGNQAVIRFSGAEGLKIPQHTDVLANVVARVENLEESLTKTDEAWLDATESLRVLLDELTERVKANEEAHVKDSDALETAKTKYDQAEEQLKSKIKEANDKRKSEDDELRMKLGGLEALSYEEDARIEKRLTKEIDDRSKGDENNSQEVKEEKEAREGKDKELERSITEESETREKGDKNLQESIDTVDREREEGDRENAESINKERTERENADAATNGRIDDEADERRQHDEDLHSKIDGEIDDRSEGDEGVEARLNTKLDNLQKDHIEEHKDLHDRVEQVTTNLEEAKMDRFQEDEHLHDRIDKANKARADGDDSLDAKLTTHKEDTQDKIDREAEARRADINNEAATRESEIQNARDAASARSDQVEADSKDRDTALQTEIQNARDAASARSDQVESDSIDRDNALQNAVDSEAADSEAATRTVTASELANAQCTKGNGAVTMDVSSNKWEFHGIPQSPSDSAAWYCDVTTTDEFIAVDASYRLTSVDPKTGVKQDPDDNAAMTSWGADTGANHRGYFSFGTPTTILDAGGTRGGDFGYHAPNNQVDVTFQGGSVSRTNVVRFGFSQSASHEDFSIDNVVITITLR